MPPRVAAAPTLGRLTARLGDGPVSARGGGRRALAAPRNPRSAILTLDAIWIYPVKGMRGRAVGEAVVEPWGLAGDRRWLVVDAQGRFLSQRETPRLAQVAAAPTEQGLVLSADGFGPCAVTAPPPDAERARVAIWRDAVDAALADPAAAEWLAEVLHRPGCRLVHMDDPGRARAVDPAYGEASDRVSFADGFPLLLTSVESLGDAQARTGSPTPMARFRPNLVVSGAPAWAEDGWAGLSVGGVELAVVKPCDRCIVTTTDQQTGARDPAGEPLATLGKFRRDGRGRILFGQNLIPRGSGRIRTGEAVSATRR